MPELSPEQLQIIRQKVHERRLIDAIRLYRLFTGVGLYEAKEVITQMFHEDPLQPNPLTESDS